MTDRLLLALLLVLLAVLVVFLVLSFTVPQEAA